MNFEFTNLDKNKLESAESISNNNFTNKITKLRGKSLVFQKNRTMTETECRIFRDKPNIFAPYLYKFPIPIILMNPTLPITLFELKYTRLISHHTYLLLSRYYRERVYRQRCIRKTWSMCFKYKRVQWCGEHI